MPLAMLAVAVAACGDPTGVVGARREAISRTAFGDVRELQIGTDVEPLQPVTVTPDAEETFSTGSLTVSGGFLPYGFIDLVGWKGDTNSWIDLYTSDLEDAGALGLGGLSGGVTRIRYVEDSDSPTVMFRNFGVAEGLRTVRVHDRGECSQRIAYRDFFEPLVAELDAELCAQIEASGLECDTRGRARLIPIVLATDPADPVLPALQFFLPDACDRTEPSVFPPDPIDVGTWGTIAVPYSLADDGPRHLGDAP